MLLLYPIIGLAGLYFDLQVSGRENKRILRERGCIVISNHCHYFDTVFAGQALFPKRLHISVAQRNFEVPVVRRMLRMVRAFPIPARALGYKTIAGPVGEALRRGDHVLILPEGDLVYLSQEIYRFKPGAFYMSCLHQAPILPMVYVFTKRLRRDGSENIHRPRIRQVFGEPVYPPPMSEDGSYPKEELGHMMVYLPAALAAEAASKPCRSCRQTTSISRFLQAAAIACTTACAAAALVMVGTPCCRAARRIS
jgi:1-acyl-sn-glycerol-3-phosphate acyltransferase